MDSILQNQRPNNVNTSVSKSRPGQSAFKWLILFGFLCAQFAYAGHQLAHGADDPGEVCQICSSFDRFDDGLTDLAPETPPAAALSGFLSVLSGVSVTDRLPIYNARASPLIPDSST